MSTNRPEQSMVPKTPDISRHDFFMGMALADLAHHALLTHTEGVRRQDIQRVVAICEQFADVMVGL